MRWDWIRMGILAFGLGLGSSWAELPLPEASQKQPSIRKPGRLPESIATWNLQWFPGHRPKPSEADQERHIDEVEKIFREIKPDLLLCQEVVDPMALVRIAGAYPWRVVSNFQRVADEEADLPVQNVAILSTVPIRESWEVGFHRLALTPDRPVRGFLAVRLGPRKNGLTAYTAHLKSNRGGREASARKRERAIDYISQDWKERGLDPQKDRILVAGDFNCSLRNPEFAGEKTIRSLLQEGWISAAEGVPWPAAATVRPDPEGKYSASDFDHILLSPGWVKGDGRRWKAEVFQDSKVPSDHYPVVLRMKETSP